MERGKELYAQKKYIEASKHFIDAIGACSCGITYREKPCLCKAVVAAIKTQSLKDELRKPCICSAKSGRRCERKLHVDALDYLAACWEKEGSLDKGVSCTEQMINLSPREPKGYLRLGKILRLQGEPLVAYEAYVVGAQLVAAKHPDHALLPMLHSQAVKVKGTARTDPLAKLPYELIRMMLGEVSFRSLCLCLRVSKTWKNVLTSAMAQDLWRTQVYSYMHHVPRGFAGPKAVFRYAAFGGNQLTDLNIDSCKRFGLKSAQLVLILSRCGKQLRHLKLRGSFVAGDVPPTKISSLRLPCLQSLYLGLGLQLGREFLRRLLVDSSQTLRELSVFDVRAEPLNIIFPHAPESPVPDDYSWPLLPKLESLALSSTVKMEMDLVSYHADSTLQNLAANLRRQPHIVSVTPALQNLWVDEISVLRDFAETPPRWANLKSMFIGNKTSDNGHLPQGSIPAGEHLEELYLEGDGFFTTTPIDLSNWPKDLALRKVSLRCGSTHINHAQLEILLRPGFEADVIEEISIHPFPFPPRAGNSRVACPDWFRSMKVTFLSVTGLALEAASSVGGVDGALLDMVERFPNLKVLDIEHEMIGDATLGKVFARGIHTIYYNGNLREDLRRWAAKTHGARLIYGPCKTTPWELPDRPAVARRLAQSSKRVKERYV